MSRSWSTACDGDVPEQGAQRGLIEDLRDESHVFVDENLAAVTRSDSGRFLTAVLQSIEAEVAQLGHFFAGSPDAEDTTGVLWALLIGKKIVI